MQILVAILVVFVVAICLPAATTPSKVVATGRSGALTATQVLDAFAKTQSRLRSVAYTVTIEDGFSGESGGARKLFYQVEVRLDATRAELRQHRWGDMTIPPNATRGKVQHAPFSREKAEYRHDLWTARTNFAYHFWDTPYWAAYRDGDPRCGRLKIGPRTSSLFEPRRKMGQFCAAGYLFGYLPGDEDRCDIVFKGASELRLRERPEPVNGVACWVLEVRRMHRGFDRRYTLWFDPEHGYNLARVHIRGTSADGNEWPWGDDHIQGIEFSRIDGIWVPTKAEWDCTQCSRPAAQTTGRIRARITAMRVNPDHAALKSFRLDDVREGAQVYLLGGDKRAIDQGVWRAGRVVDATGKILLTFPPPFIEQRDPAQTQPSPSPLLPP